MCTRLATVAFGDRCAPSSMMQSCSKIDPVFIIQAFPNFVNGFTTAFANITEQDILYENLLNHCSLMNYCCEFNSMFFQFCRHIQSCCIVQSNSNDYFVKIFQNILNGCLIFIQQCISFYLQHFRYISLLRN